MSWINLCAQRHRNAADLDEDEFEEDELCDDPPAAMPILLGCAIVGDMDRLARNAHVILEAYRSWESDLAKGRRIPTSLLVLQEYLSLSVLLDLIGEADHGVRDWAGRFPFGPNPEDKAMARVVEVLAGAPEPEGMVAPEGHTEDQLEWPRIAARTPVADLLDLAACPGHEFWHRLQYWMAPAAAAVSARTGLSVAELLCWGRHVSAAEKVVFQRTEPVPADGPRGFDAVVSTRDGPAGCHDLSMVDAYHTPEELAAILSGAPQDWTAAGSQGDAVRIYCNPALDRIRAHDLAQAARDTGVLATLHSFLDAP